MTKYDFLKKIVSGAGRILKPWLDKPNVYYAQYTYQTGVDIYGGSVYSYADGVVVAVGRDADDLVSVIVQYDAYSCLQYCHMAMSMVEAGDVVQAGFALGVTHGYVHFEYLTKEESRWPVRVGTETYYRQNPIKMLGDGND